MFERFTEKAIKTIMLAQEEARRLGHNFVSPEFLLLGMIGEGTGLAAISLKNFGITLKGARQTVEKHLGRGSGFVSVEIPFTPPAKKSLEASWYAARDLGHNYIGTEHLLIGVMETDDATCLQILEELQLDREKVKADVRGRIARFPNQERPLESQSGQTESPKGFPAAEAASPRSRASAVKIPCIECGELISPKAARCLFCNAGFDDELFKKCPYCAESVRKAAIKCRWCQSDLSSADV